MRSPRTENNRRIHFEVRRGRSNQEFAAKPERFVVVSSVVQILAGQMCLDGLPVSEILLFSKIRQSFFGEYFDPAS